MKHPTLKLSEEETMPRYTSKDQIDRRKIMYGASLHAWIDDYCRGKPDNDLTEAVVSLKDELLTRAR